MTKDIKSMGGSKNGPKKKETPPEKEARVNSELEGFKIGVDPFGEVQSNFDIDRINKFLDKSVDDKKLRSKPDRAEGQPKTKAEDDTND